MLPSLASGSGIDVDAQPATMAARRLIRNILFWLISAVLLMVFRMLGKIFPALSI
jgi:hypothetical protein